MAGEKTQGPERGGYIDTGTLCRANSHKPGIICGIENPVMKQKRSSAKPIISINNIDSKEQVIAQIYFPTNSDKLDAQDKGVLDNVCTSLKALNLKIGCFADVWVFGGADHRGGSAYNLELGKRRAASVRKYIESKGFIGAKVRANA